MIGLAPGTAPLLPPDRRMVQAFAEAVFGYVEGFVAVRMLTEAGAPVRAPWTECVPADADLGQRLFECAERAARDGRALFVVPATLRERGRAPAESIAETAVIVVDLDVGDIAAKRAHLVEHLGAPTLAVASGGITEDGARKLHLYWRLTEAARGADLETVARLRSVLAGKAGADAAFGRMTQPIRVPGSLHGKKAPSVLVEILETNGRDHDLAEIAARIDRMPALTPSGASPVRTAAASLTNGGSRTEVKFRARDLTSMTVHAGGIDEITRYDALSKVIGHWLRCARLGTVDLDDAWAAVREHNAAMIVPPRDEALLRRDFDALHRRDRSRPETAGAAVRLGPPFSDDSLAAAFVEQHGEDWRHVAASRSWKRWGDGRWVNDDTRAVVAEIRSLCRTAASQSKVPNEAKWASSAKTIAAVERLAATDPAVAVTPSAFDAGTTLLNTAGGIIDLETGEVLPCRRAMMMTKRTGAEPSGTSPIWTRFLAQITGGDAEMQGYLRRLAGYCLTGSIEEQVFFFLHGHGANGKSVFIDTLRAALGDYARVAPFETFAATSFGSHPTDLAGLCGARMVVVAETEKNRAWAESRIKAITGGDPISARFMRGDFFEYRPTFKLVIAGNHRPRLASFGEAMRRRLHLVPFDVTIPRERRDPALPARLLGELGGVLSWMIEGHAEWHERGLAAPSRIASAADTYFEDEDLVGEWISARCILGHDRTATSAALFLDWSAFATAQGEPAGTQRGLADDLTARGFVPVRSSRSRGWAGIGLRGQEPPA